MKYLIIGAGAIGTYIGGSLLKIGKKVIFLEREEVIPIFKKNGLRIVLEETVFSASNIQVFSDFDQATRETVDVVIFAMKSFDTDSAARMVSEYKDRFRVVLCLQNGVENESIIAEYIGEEKIIGGSVTSAIERVETGSAKLEKKRGIGIADIHPISKMINTDFDAAGLNSRLYPVLMDLKWSKMCSNLLGNATSAILNMTPEEVFSNPDVYKIECKEMVEAVSVMEKSGIRVVNLPGVPMKLLLWVMLNLPHDVSRLLLSKVIGSGRGGKMPSFHIDLHSGSKRMESGYLNGAVSRWGREVLIPTPVNDILDKTIQLLVNEPELIKAYDHNVTKLVDTIKAIATSP